MKRAFSYFASAPLRTALPILAALALLLNFVLEVLGRRSFAEAFVYHIRSPQMILLSTLIILFTLSLCLLVRRRVTLLLILCTVWLALGVSNYIVLSYRSSPLSAIDLLIAKAALSMFDIYFTLVQTVLLIVIAAAFAATLVLLYIKCPKCSVCYKSSVGCIAAIGAVMCGLFTFTTGTQAVEYDSGELAEAYDDYGFAYCFTRSLVSKGVERPENFSVDSLDAVLDALDMDVQEEETSTPNIIFVQLESFCDVSRIDGISCSENPTPGFTALKEAGICGALTVPHVGGGTANVEFEVLTGMNLDHFGFGEYPYTTVLCDRACESLAGNLKTLGYVTHAIHNHAATFYDRHRVYPNLGFDTFTPIEMMSDVTRNPLGWAKDAVLTGEIVSALDSTDGADFVFAVSVQGHGKYPEEYDASGIEVYGAGEAAGQYRYYVSQLREMDDFIVSLTATLEARSEPCMVVFYGDHMPSIPLDGMTDDTLYQTEYAVWSNFPLEGEDRDLAAYELAAYVQQLLGFEAGAVTRLHQAELADGAVYDEELRMLEYAQLYDGEGFAAAGMRLGTRAITVSGAIQRGNTLYVTGSGFNEYSRVRLDGFLRETQFIDAQTLAVENVYFAVGELCVVQVAEDGTELYTAEYAGE